MDAREYCQEPARDTFVDLKSDISTLCYAVASALNCSFECHHKSHERLSHEYSAAGLMASEIADAGFLRFLSDVAYLESTATR